MPVWSDGSFARAVVEPVGVRVLEPQQGLARPSVLERRRPQEGEARGQGVGQGQRRDLEPVAFGVFQCQNMRAGGQGQGAVRVEEGLVDAAVFGK